ncbi:MAG: phosphoglucosamine mutase, partial [bacterium]|nr:phosphoglucosamine mutase [bacterium]
IPQKIYNLQVKLKPELKEDFINFVKDKEKEIEGRINVRYSGTENYLRIMVETEHTELIRIIIKDIVKEYKRCHFY